MPPARRVSGLRVDSKTAPKMVGEMPDQLKPLEASSSRSSLISGVKLGISISPSKSPPLT